MILLEIDPAIPLLISVLGTLGSLGLGLIIYATQTKRAEKQETATTELRTATNGKADSSYVLIMEGRLTAALAAATSADARANLAEKRADRAEKQVDACTKRLDAMQDKIALLERQIDVLREEAK